MYLLTAWNGLLWQWILPVLLTVTAIVCGIRQRGRPVRGLGGVLRRTYGSLLSRNADRQQWRPHWQRRWARAISSGQRWLS